MSGEPGFRDVWREYPRLSWACTVAYAAGVAMILASLPARSWAWWWPLWGGGFAVCTISGVWWLAACRRLFRQPARE